MAAVEKGPVGLPAQKIMTSVGEPAFGSGLTDAIAKLGVENSGWKRVDNALVGPGGSMFLMGDSFSAERKITEVRNSLAETTSQNGVVPTVQGTAPKGGLH